MNNRYRDSDNKRLQAVVYTKRVNGNYYVFEAVPDSKAKTLQIISAYKTKAEGVSQVLNMPESPQLTSETPHAFAPSDNNVAQTKSYVKSVPATVDGRSVTVSGIDRIETSGNRAQMVLYDIVDFTPTKFELKNENAFTEQPLKVQLSRQHASSDTRVTQSEPSVNSSISEKTQNDAKKFSLKDTTNESDSQTKSEAFKEWFGDWENEPESASKVVNEDGTPKVVYHGTGNEFFVFDRKNKEKIIGKAKADFSSLRIKELQRTTQSSQQTTAEQPELLKRIFR